MNKIYNLDAFLAQNGVMDCDLTYAVIKILDAGRDAETPYNTIVGRIQQLLHGIRLELGTIKLHCFARPKGRDVHCWIVVQNPRTFQEVSVAEVWVDGSNNTRVEWMYEEDLDGGGCGSVQCSHCHGTADCEDPGWCCEHTGNPEVRCEP